MSMTSTKRPLEKALADARDLLKLIGDTVIRVEIAGSVRRKGAEVGDVEYVVQHRIVSRPGPNLFAEPVMVDLLNERLDELVAQRRIIKHWYGGSGYRWGDKYRGVDFRNHLHEFWAADDVNWGSRLTVLTGPADFSHRLMQKFNAAGFYRQIDGYLTVIQSGERVVVPDEQTYFRLAGMPWVEPEGRK